MNAQGHFEPLFKMSHQAPNSTPALALPVKFRSVVYDTKLLEEETRLQEDDSDTESVSFDTESAQPAERNVKNFFKNPLQFPNQYLAEEDPGETAPSSSKLGKSMRSSSGLGETGGHKIYKLMAEGQRILDLQKEQNIRYNKQVAAEQTAAVLVNDLLRHGFHITPPESTPRPIDESWTSPTVSPSEEDSVKHVVGNQLIVAMHRELKRLQTSDAEIS